MLTQCSIDLERLAPKLKGITSMSVKEVVTSLVDDGMVDTDKEHYQSHLQFLFSLTDTFFRH